MKDQHRHQQLFSIVLALALVGALTLSSFATPQAARGSQQTADNRQQNDDGRDNPDVSHSAIKAAATSDSDAAVAPKANPSPVEEVTEPESAGPESMSAPVQPVIDASDAFIDPTRQDSMATLTVRGQVNVDGNPAKTGATVMSGNTISTGSDGNAIIDLGPLGRVEIRPNTVLTVVFSGSSIELKPQCGHTRVSVLHGKATVKSSSARPIDVPEGQDLTVDGPLTLDGTPGTDLAIGCTAAPSGPSPSSSPHGGYVTGGKIGVIALLGVAGGIAAGIVTHGSGSSNPAPPEASSIQR
ncbi:MAG TPA: hypothetical protein VI756_30885 [Blastocatellia bacterium]